MIKSFKHILAFAAAISITAVASAQSHSYSLGKWSEIQNAIIKEQEGTIKEQETMLSTTIKMLMNVGMHLDQIAASLGVDLDTVTRLAQQKEFTV